MEALLLLTLLAQTPAPVSPDPAESFFEPVSRWLGDRLDLWFSSPEFSLGPLFEPPDPLLLTYRRYFCPNVTFYSGADPRITYLLEQDEWYRFSAVAWLGGFGTEYELYLGNGCASRVEFRTNRFRIAPVLALVWFTAPDGESVTLTLDCLRGWILLPDPIELVCLARSEATLYFVRKLMHP